MDQQKQRQKHEQSKHSKQKKGKGTTPTQPDAPEWRAMKMADAGPTLIHQPPAISLMEPAEHEVARFETKPKPFMRNDDPWDEAVLTPLGLYYPLGPLKTRLPVRDLPRILQALRGVFRTQSLYARYKNSPISAICLSLDQVELEVVLFGARENPEEMILEISRRDGDSFSYHRYAEQIMAAVKSDGSEELRPVFSFFWNIKMLSQVESLEGLGEGAQGKGVAEAIEIACGMVSTDRYDARRLGLETIVHITDPSKSGWSTAKAAAESLIRPSGAIQERLSKGVIEYACQDEQSQEVGGPMFGIAMESDIAYLGLIIVAQTLQLAAEAKTMHERDIEAFLSGSPDFVGNLLQKVSDVQSNPHRAYYAVQCLSALCNCVPSTKSRIKGSEVEEAQLVGESSHLALAMVTQKLLVSLQA